MAVDPYQRARLDDLERKFGEGLRVFRDAGKSVDTLPWFLMVGPSGSGKSELIRRSTVGFPPGLQDPMQGMGGTLSIHWWFTNYAVLLDIAGGLTNNAARDSEWEALIEHVRIARPRTPVNGIVVVLSAYQLLVQPEVEVVRGARALRRALDVLSRSFRSLLLPVNVFVSHCDRLVGYREFTDFLQDPLAAQQILGSSWRGRDVHAPAETRVQLATRSLRDRLWKRALGYLPWCLNQETATSLLCLPESFDRLAQRVGVASARLFPDDQSGSALQLRGLYFGNAMREGGVLDPAAAAMQNIPLPEYSSGWADSEHKSAFVRDVLLSKVFRERDLAAFERVSMFGRMVQRLFPRPRVQVQVPASEAELIRQVTPVEARSSAPSRPVPPRPAAESGAAPRTLPGSPQIGPGRLRSPKGLMPYTGPDRFAFLSYANRDAETVLPWLESVDEAGLRVWWDAGITAGRPYNDVIAERIRACTVFVVFLTPGVVDSEWVQDEIDQAKKLRKTRIAVTASEITIPDGLDLLLGRMQRIETMNRAESLRQLCESLRLHLTPSV